ncbi:MAG: homogentisate 1,2-dioxygenase, partial [Frankiaceae bacterium]|nr:homogentisate 1,2-dioxygenase [Frankiaceae bacterium]
MPYYRSVGEIPPKRHTQFRQPDGSLYAEELMGVEGFSSDSALLYHRHLPTAITDAVAVDELAPRLVPNHPLKPRHLRTHKLDIASVDAVTGRQLLLGNDDVRISYVVADQQSPLYRNAAGDEMLYVESGEATVETV